MIYRKLAVITIHDVNPSHSEGILKTCYELNKLKIKYNLSIVPYYCKRYNLKDYPDFCDRIYSLLQAGNVELSLHGLYHQVDGKIEDFDVGTKEEEKQEIQEGLDILSAANLPRPSMFIPPAWHLSRQCIEALKELNFSISESMTHIEFIQEDKKYILHPVMNWDQQGDKEKNKQTLEQNKEMFYKRIFNVNGKTNGLFRMAIHPPYDPDEALQDQIEMIKYIKEKEGYELIKYSDLIISNQKTPIDSNFLQIFQQRSIRKV
jgi:predicted deacetylase